MKKKTDAERAREYRKRKKLREAGLLPPPPAPLKVEIPRICSLSQFARSLDEEDQEFLEWLKDEMGLPVEQFFADENKTEEIEWTQNTIRNLEDALSGLTGILRRYWLSEIDREINRIKSEEITNPEKSEPGLEKILQLTESRKGLEKIYRLNLSNYIPEI